MIHLNGWQRLWIVIAVLWAVVVLLVTWGSWPTNADLSEKEISTRLSDVPDAAIRHELTAVENATLATDAAELLVAKVGGHIENPYADPDLTSVPEPDPQWRATQTTTSTQKPSVLSIHEFAQRIKAKYPQYAGWSDDVLTGGVLAKYPVYRDQVDPHEVAAASQRYDDLIKVQAHISAIAKTIATETLVASKRKNAVLTAIAAWLGPIAVLYAMGWSVAWIRRGFKGSATG
jgi:hypothetical protein